MGRVRTLESSQSITGPKRHGLSGKTILCLRSRKGIFGANFFFLFDLPMLQSLSLPPPPPYLSMNVPEKDKLTTFVLCFWPCLKKTKGRNPLKLAYTSNLLVQKYCQDKNGFWLVFFFLSGIPTRSVFFTQENWVSSGLQGINVSVFANLRTGLSRGACRSSVGWPGWVGTLLSLCHINQMGTITSKKQNLIPGMIWKDYSQRNWIPIPMDH